MESKPKGDFTPIEALLMEAIASRVIVESVRLKLFDHLESPKTAEEIAQAFEIAEEGASVLLELLTERELLTKSKGSYVNNPAASEFLVSTSPFLQGDFIEIKQGFMEMVTNEMEALLHQPGILSRQASQKVPQSIYCRGVIQYATRGSLQDLIQAITKQNGFSEMKVMCDLGGNHGRYSMALLEKNPQLTAEILDLPKVTPLSKQFVREAGFEERITVKDFDLKTDSLEPHAYDLMLVSHVLQVFADDLDNTINKIGQSVKKGGWFVSQNMNPEADCDQKLKTSNDLLSRLLAHANHYISEDAIRTALQKADFGEIQVQSSGPNNTNMIVIAKKN